MSQQILGVEIRMLSFMKWKINSIIMFYHFTLIAPKKKQWKFFLSFSLKGAGMRSNSLSHQALSSLKKIHPMIDLQIK